MMASVPALERLMREARPQEGDRDLQNGSQKRGVPSATLVRETNRRRPFIFLELFAGHGGFTGASSVTSTTRCSS